MLHESCDLSIPLNKSAILSTALDKKQISMFCSCVSSQTSVLVFIYIKTRRLSSTSLKWRNTIASIPLYILHMSHWVVTCGVFKVDKIEKCRPNYESISLAYEIALKATIRKLRAAIFQYLQLNRSTLTYMLSVKILITLIVVLWKVGNTLIIFTHPLYERRVKW